MFHNKKSFFCCSMMLIVLGMLMCALASPCAAQVDQKEGPNIWWQKEIPPAGQGKIINPVYISKRETLKKSWSQLHRQNTMTRQYNRWTNRGYAYGPKRTNDARARAERNRLKRELRKIPKYIDASAKPVPGPGPEPAPGQVIIKY